MKKLFNGKFLIILASSLTMLILLVVGAFYLFNDSDDMFIKSGYVINPLSETTERYFFNENTEYRVNLSQMVEFTDVDKKEVSILKDSFLHYTDGSMSFLKNGAILDLNSIKGKTAVLFYNITSKSIIQKNDKGYTISSKDKEIKLDNFIGRINDNKYIVVGDLKAKIPGNTTDISGDYFEIVYIENGVINIENKDVKYQVAAEGTKVYVGDIVIDLGDKKITKNDEDIMSITEITIDGDENVEIIPKVTDDKDDGNNGNDEDGDGNNQGGTEPDGTGDGQGGSNDIDGEIQKTEDTIVSLKDVSIGSTNIDVIFDVINKKEDDILRLNVTNVSNGRTVDNTLVVNSDVLLRTNLLSPQTKYLLTVVSEVSGSKYFQKIFETKDFGIKLDKSYATESELGYTVTIDKETDVTGAKLSLYKFNEETGKNEIVRDSYYDEASDTTIYVDRVYEINSSAGDVNGEQKFIFGNLESNTIYTAVLDQFSFESSNFRDVYNLTNTSMTLKRRPTFNEMLVNKDIGKGSFKLSLDNISDPDKAISKYTYLIYEKSNPDKVAIDPITKGDASSIEVMIGTGKNQLKNDTNYFYKVIIEYYDNEKYIEYITSDSINFVMGSDPVVTVIPDDKKISYDRIGATIILTDNSCLVTMPGRDECSGESQVLVEVSKINSSMGEGDTKINVFQEVVKFTVDGTEIKYDLELDGLQAGTMYTITVKSPFNDRDGMQVIENSETSKPNISTKTLSSFEASWLDKGSSARHVINLETKLNGKSGTGTLNSDESAMAINRLVLKLYLGNDINLGQDPIKVVEFRNTEDFNIKENFYDKAYEITTNETFGLDLEQLKALSADGKLSEYYTIKMEGYYNTNNRVVIDSDTKVYMVSPELLQENVEEPTIRLEKITNRMSGNLIPNIAGDTTVGYIVHASFDRAGLIANQLIPMKIKVYVYNEQGEMVDFYIKGSDGSLSLVNNTLEELDETGFYSQEIYMANGTDYNQIDTVMSRGNGYYVGYELLLDTAKGEIRYPSSNNTFTYSDYGIYEHTIADKENPKVLMHVASSTETGITYKYTVSDYDRAIYSEDGNTYEFYYQINGGNEYRLPMQKDNYVFSGEFTINGLTNNDYYTLYYKKAVNKTGDMLTDVKPYIEGGERLFDGYYDANDSKYNFNFEVINNPMTSNKVTIKMLAETELLDRVVWYKVKFSDSLGNTLNKEFGRLSKCNIDDSVERCYTLDYVELMNAGMKSDKNKTNNITVSVEAFYDNGLMGYDYCNGDKNQYMIIQNNSNKDSLGEYVISSYSISNGKKNFFLTKWNREIELPRGYYTCKVRGQFIDYYSVIDDNELSFKILKETSLGYDSNYGIINPKLVSSDNMKSVNNEFSFSSITPTVSVSDKSKMLNGEIKNLKLSGINLDDVKEEDGEYYLYIDVWDNLDDAKNGDVNKKVRPTIKVAIDKNNPLNTLSATIDKLNLGNTYYFNVYAYLYKNNQYVYTQLFDDRYKDNYEVSTYTVRPINYNEIYSKKEYEILKNNKAYGSKDFKAIVTLNNYPYNFDLAYVLCDAESNCDMENNIFKETKPMSEVKNITEFITNIDEYDLEFNKSYVMKIYAIIDVYNDMKLEKKTILLNPMDNSVRLRSLSEPTFVVTRKSKYEGDKYLIDINVNVVDNNETLKDGIYYVKLLDESGLVVGSLEQLDSDGNYVTINDYENHEFSAEDINKRIRFTDLEENTKYTIMVYGTAYVNNYSEDISKEEREYEISKSHTIYTTNSYGVSFGKDVIASATENSIVVTFLGGTNFDKVMEVNYTADLVDGTSSSKMYNGTDVVGAGNNKFEIYAGTDNYSYVIMPDGMKNEDGAVLNVKVTFKVEFPEEDMGYVILDVYEGKVQYRIDEEK